MPGKIDTRVRTHSNRVHKRALVLGGLYVALLGSFLGFLLALGGAV
jgi:hypothetical protein